MAQSPSRAFCELSGKVLAVVADCEATGLNSQLDDAIDLAAVADAFKVPSDGGPVKWEERQDLPEFSKYIRSEHEQLTPFICKFTGIKQSQVDSADAFSEVYDKHLEWIRALREKVQPDVTVYIMHNGKPFDLPLLVRQARCAGCDFIGGLKSVGVSCVIDTLDCSKLYLRAEVDGAPTNPGYNPTQKDDDTKSSDKQGDIYRHLFGSDPSPAEGRSHTGIGDARQLLRIVRAAPFCNTFSKHRASIAVSLDQHAVRERVLERRWTAEQGGYSRDTGRPKCQQVDGFHLARATSNKPSASAANRVFSCSRTQHKVFVAGGGQQNCGCTFEMTVPKVRAGYTPPPAAAKPRPSVGVKRACCCTTKCGTKACPCFPGLCGPACHFGLGAGAKKCHNSAARKLEAREAKAWKAAEKKAAKVAKKKAAGASAAAPATD